MIKELNILVDNKPGRLKAITGILKKQSINIRAVTSHIREQFGIVKMIVDNPDKAHVALSEGGLACSMKDIIAVNLKDSPGGLDEILDVFTLNNINIKDSYGFVIDSGNNAVFCVETIDNKKAIEIIQKNGYKVLNDKDIYNL